MITTAGATRRVSRLGANLARLLEASPRLLGHVHSVFDRTVNVLTRGDRLLTIQGPGPLAAPFALAMDGPGLPFHATEPGMPVEHVDQSLIAGELRLDWSSAARADLEIRPSRECGPLAAALLDSRLPAGAPSLCSARAIDACRRLASGIAQRDSQLFIHGALDLVGLGEGLTPAGDDCLVGALAVLCGLRPDLLPGDPDVGRAIASAARSGTTAVAREFLLHALDGAFAEVLVDLMRAPTAEHARICVGRLLQMGATSGRDTAFGMRLALVAITPR